MRSGKSFVAFSLHQLHPAPDADWLLENSDLLRSPNTKTLPIHGGKLHNCISYKILIPICTCTFIFVLFLVLYLILEITVSNQVKRAVLVKHNLVSYLIARCWFYSFSAICDFEERHHMRSISQMLWQPNYITVYHSTYDKPIIGWQNKPD